jgi:hypothetical protein
VGMGCFDVVKHMGACFAEADTLSATAQRESVVAVADWLNNTRGGLRPWLPFQATQSTLLWRGDAPSWWPHMQDAVEIIKKNKKMGMRDFNVRVRALAVRVDASNGAIADEDDAGDQIDC